jgi:hypothetical protein
MDQGFYRGVEPVAVIAVSNTGGLPEALRGMVARDNPIVPMLRRSEIQPPVLLKHAGVKSWSAFERDMLFWDVTKDSGAYQIAGQSKHPEGMWKDDPERTIPPGATDDDVIDRMITILQGAAQK